MLTELEDRLAPFITEYDNKLEALHKNPSLPAPDTAHYKSSCLSLLEGRMEALSADDPEYKECEFITRSLKNGWTVSDIMMLSSLYQSVTVKAPEDRRAEGRKILDQYAFKKINTLDARIEMARITKTYLEAIWHTVPSFSKSVSDFGLRNGRKIIFPFEYPDDKNFAATAGKNNPAAGVLYDDIVLEDFAAYQDRRNESARNNQEYIMEEGDPVITEPGQEKPFVPNDGQRHNKMTIPASKAVADIYGKAVYDEIDEMSRGNAAERTVRLHHALGTKNQKAGHHVLQLEFAGTGGRDVIKHQHERNGGIDTTLSEEEYKARYGFKAQKPGKNEFFDHIHYKDNGITLPGGERLEKKRYAFGGPRLINLLDYSIENTREYASQYAAQFIKPIFDEWIRTGKEPTTINIDLNGHSRGAVTAGQTAKLIHKWVKNYCDTVPGAKDFYKNVKYDLRMYEPVPGMITDLHMGHVNLSEIPNMNATVFCSLGIAQPDFAFPLQQVKGANKVILAMTDHAIDTTLTDKSQMSTQGDTKEHAKGYYDAETGEMHRASGLSELPDGVYVSDEKHNLIRITSYSQTVDLFAKVYDKTSPQRLRAQRIHRMARDWFCEHELKTSFKDERERKTETAKNDLTQSKILAVDTKRIRGVKEQIRRLQELKQGKHSKSELIKQNEDLIKACRAYMKDTTMPPYGETARKVKLVADTLSFTMRENNQLRKELKIEKGEAYDSELDDKIKAHQERLEKKSGYLKRKQELETKRLNEEKRVVKLIELTKKTCRDALDILDITRIGKSTSGSYDKFHEVLTQGSKLTTKTSINDLSEYLKNLQKVSNSYAASHDSLFGPITDDGVTRLLKSQGMTTYGQKAAEKLDEIAAGLDGKDVPLAVKMNEREERIREMSSKEKILNGENVQQQGPVGQNAQPSL